MKNKPKGATTSYALFVKDRVHDALSQNPNGKTTEVLRDLAAQWHQLDSATKQGYAETSKSERARYQDRLKSWHDSLSAADLVILDRRKKLLRLLGKTLPTGFPKKKGKSSGLARFVKMCYERDGDELRDILKLGGGEALPSQNEQRFALIAKRYVSLSDEEKKPFIDEANAINAKSEKLLDNGAAVMIDEAKSAAKAKLAPKKRKAKKAVKKPAKKAAKKPATAPAKKKTAKKPAKKAKA
ncbi:hypothetical protein HDU91_004107 [Kappamyces sp. JEL0680]|nr:hypothetical protein HDU91_004107 [Kappamyces sp. JEL0680]